MVRAAKAKEVYKAEFDALKADTIKVIEAIDLTAYSVDAKGAYWKVTMIRQKD